MFELVPVSVTFESLIKIILIIGTNMLLGYIWYSPSCFQKQWKQAKGIKDDIPCTNNAILMSNIGTLANAFLLHILLIAFDIRRQQWIGAILTSAILSGFYAVSSFQNKEISIDISF